MATKMRMRAGEALRNAGMPEDVVLGMARVTMIGSDRARVENHQGLLELSSERIRLRTQAGSILLEGSGLKLRFLTSHTAEIEGNIRHTQQ